MNLIKPFVKYELSHHHKLLFLLLPLTGFNILSFGVYENIQQGYITSHKNQNYIVIELNNKIPRNYINNSNFVLDWDEYDEDGKFLKTNVLINVPTIFNNEVECYIKGTFKKYNKKAVELITVNSGLAYNSYDETLKTKISSALILSLNREPVAKQYLENKIGCKLSANAEFISKPDSEKEVIVIFNESFNLC